MLCKCILKQIRAYYKKTVQFGYFWLLLVNQKSDLQYTHAGVFTHLADIDLTSGLFDWHLPHSIAEFSCTYGQGDLHLEFGDVSELSNPTGT